MTRLERSKNKLTNEIEKNRREEKIFLVFQELLNNLPTYEEQKEFHQFFKKVKKDKAS